MSRSSAFLLLRALPILLLVPGHAVADPPAYQGSWGTYGSGPGQFTGPVGIAVTSDGSVLVSDGGSRVQRFTPNGQYIGEFGPYGTGPGEFNNPAGIAQDGSGNLYVTDALNQRVQKLSLIHISEPTRRS